MRNAHLWLAVSHTNLSGMKCAAAAFVKTPTLSPLKTRLAQSIGPEAAEHFYLLSTRAVQAFLSEAALLTAGAIQPFWAVAEKPALKHKLWGVFPVLHQGEGDLGARLNHVYASLLARGDGVMLLGADSPQLRGKLLVHAMELLCRPDVDFVAGPSYDGGFYLFAGKKSIPAPCWKNVPWSQSTTLSTLLSGLKEIGHVELLPAHLDIDTAEDLKKLEDLFLSLKSDEISDELNDLRSWLQQRESLKAKKP